MIGPAPAWTRLNRSIESAASSASHTWQGFLRWVLHKPARSVWVSGAFGLGLAATITVTAGFPPPRIHDEFSYLLAGDTFAHGRLSYPTHPMWRHFETFHVLQEPRYASKYPPAQGLVLALGQRLTGLPIAGVWISCGLLIATLNWMLRAWTRPRWALWGAVGAALWLGGWHAITGYWAHSFWGGSVAAIGGALVLGGVRRLVPIPSVSASVAVGIGLGILANSRPFEGAFFALAPMAMIAWVVVTLLRSRRLRLALTAVAPMLIVLVTTAALMGFYNRSISGSAMRPPYIAYDAQYASSPHIVGQSRPPTPEYRVPAMRQFFLQGSGYAGRPESWREHARMLRYNSQLLVRFYGPWFIVPLLVMLPLVGRGPWMTVAIASVAGTTIALGLTLYVLQPHYAAPAAAAWCLLLTQSARFTRQLRWRRIRAGRGMIRAIAACLVLSVIMQLAVGRQQRQNPITAWRWERQAIARSLSPDRKHLVLVEYGPRHVPNDEWVFNPGDIDAAPVVWARSLGQSADAVLLRYFSNRAAWRLHVDAQEGPFIFGPWTAAVSDSARQAPPPP